MNITRKIILLFSFVSLFFCIVTINKTYAKYNTNVDGVTNISVARWHILVNNQDIRNNSTTSAVLTPTIIANPHVSENVIAPTSEGYVDLNIDSTDVDVSFSYTITPDVDDSSSVSDLVVTGYTLNDGELTTLSNGESITNNIYLSNNTNFTSIRIYLKWDDSETNQMNNADDANATLSTENAKMKISLNFKQIAG